MKREDLIGYEKKKVLLVLKNGYNYTGKTLEFNEETIKILDKFNLTVKLDIDSISVIEEVRDA